jgi:hypothetical protein
MDWLEKHPAMFSAFAATIVGTMAAIVMALRDLTRWWCNQGDRMGSGGGDGLELVFNPASAEDEVSEVT